MRKVWFTKARRAMIASQRAKMIGERFGRLIIIAEAAPYIKPKSGKPVRQFLCLCDCGVKKIIVGSSLTRGLTKSCGCFRDEQIRSANTTHGETRFYPQVSTEYKIWAGMKQRCSDPTLPGYKNYGGRGIKVCERWINSFENFLTDMGRRPAPHLTLDRYPNNDGDYEPGNCRWATRSEQLYNSRRSLAYKLSQRSN